MATALYRRYRPENFAEMIGQSQVTEPLMTALRTGRVNHAYLFSGPRGCGKTSSARILARCLNCAEGPTDTPCGVCQSCVELARDGGGSLDVFEIDAASHGGVEDARELRERAILAPSRDRYKIFIIDEAHMVTSAGFNALLKVVEEPPEHVRFVFATTEPEKVIGTIRSRTHHYPFRLIPPALMLEYVEELCTSEGVTAEPGVLPLVVRAGGGSARDTLSLLDQIIAGSETGLLGYQRAAALLGFTGQELLDESIDAFADADPAAAYTAVDRVIQSGQDPRRYVEDLLERLRDLIVAKATGPGAGAVLRGLGADEVEALRVQAGRFSPAALTGIADLVNETLTEMSGVTSPKLHLELLVARILVASRADFIDSGTLLAVADAPGTSPMRLAAAAAAPAVAAPAALPVSTVAAPGQEPAPAAAPEPSSERQPQAQSAPRPVQNADSAPSERQAPPATPAAPSVPSAAEPDTASAARLAAASWAAATPGSGVAPATAAPEPTVSAPEPAAPEPVVLAPGSSDAPADADAPAEDEPAAPSVAASAAAPASGGAPASDVESAPGTESAPEIEAAALGTARDTASEPGPAPDPDVTSAPEPASALDVASAPETAPSSEVAPAPAPAPASEAAPGGAADPAHAPAPHATAARASAEPPVFAQLRDAWPTLLERMRDLGGTHAWSVAQSVHPRDLAGDLLVFEVPSRAVLDQFRGERGATDSPSAVLRTAINEMFGITVKFQPQRPGGAATGGAGSAQAANRADEPASAPAEPDPARGRQSDAARAQGTSGGAAAPRSQAGQPAQRERAAATPAANAEAPAAHSAQATSAAGPSSGLNWTVAKIPGQQSLPDDGPGSGWATAAIPGAGAAQGAASATRAPAASAPAASAVVSAPAEAPVATQTAAVDEAQAPAAPPAPKGTQRVASAPVIPGVERYGEAIVRERLGARFIGEDIIVPEPEAVELPPDDDFSAPPPPEDGGY
ncbi:DNA polymerase III subunit gamma and tau [Pseudoclavibacter sp. RFBA6]|uniref:DNA polymerase III subunit gamma and tau n=1 Tax=Pseudoclavibacter sp. RFBA6 TaxID=2080573 RepID=UPI000CE93514|nr:DNA polymerase III subunit gamma and tau [Pseudoclavibacter sp. RFBA6]PPG42203.1 DNA polymerase III, subunit gamma and tau [Pseudoclavibacter sp. RFBA6]